MIKIKWNFFDYILLSVIAVFLIKIFLFQTYKVESDSMYPTLYPGDHILCFSPVFFSIPEVVNNKIKLKKSIDRFDIVVFKSPIYPYEEYIKRVIGKGGDILSILSNKVIINGRSLDEPYAYFDNSLFGYSNQLPVIIKTNYIFLMGDNRNHSSDSRIWGPVHIKRVEGKLFMIYWPLKHFKIFINRRK